MISRLRNSFKYYPELGKLKIMVPVSLTGFTGYFIFDPHITSKIFIVSFGIFLLAASASILNQVQEVDIDRKMERTKNRPIPAGNVTTRQAMILFFLTFIAGTVITFIAGNFTAVVIGLITILWYNGIYTYLKRITAFAVFPGAVTGALPPLIGWVAAGGHVWDKAIIFIQFLFFIGQIPHFWLLILKYGEEYEKAGIPTLARILTRQQIERLTFIWVLTAVTGAIFLCSFEIIQTWLAMGILLFASSVLIWQFSDLLKTRADNSNSGKYSLMLNSYFLLVLLLLISDRIIG
jgi:protoheme IX farnesyltransferase